MKPWLTVIGIGDSGVDTLTPEAARHLAEAATVFGGRRHLAMLGGSGQEMVAWRSPFSAALDDLETRRGRPVAVLASGDPMWFGVGATLAERFGPGEMLVLPAPSAFSLAASRLGWPLDGCHCLTVHGRPVAALSRHFAPGARLLVLSEDRSSPLQIAELLAARGFGASRLTVLEHLGGTGECVRQARADRFELTDVADLNTVAVECHAESASAALPLVPGLPDEAFRHDGKMTKRVLRALALAALEPFPGALLWDVGAGCGSVSVEWLRAARGAEALAIEPSADRRSMIAENAATLGVPQLQIVAGGAPEALAGLPEPDAVFIGGGLGSGAFEPSWAALKPGGRLAAHAVTLESEAILLDLHARLGGDLLRVAVDRAEPVGPFRGWRPAMPVVHWHVRKPSPVAAERDSRR